MSHLHKSFQLHAGDCVQVSLDQQANVLLLDNANYQNYKRGSRYSYIGGLATRSPYNIQAPRTGSFHVVVDLGGRSGKLKASINII